MTEPEPHLGGRQIPWPRGRVLGGSSSINGMVYMRGNRYDYDGWAQSEEYIAEREVILSCGTIGSPMALMHSGIGNAGHLRKLGITPIVDCKSVGENLQDHLQVYITHASLTPDEIYDETRLDRAALRMMQAFCFGTGPFSRFPFGAAPSFARARASRRRISRFISLSAACRASAIRS